MEQNIQEDETSFESDTIQENTHSESPLITEIKEQEETEEEKRERAFKIDMQTILQKIKDLPSDTSELKMPTGIRDCKDIYIKLCKALKVPESSIFLTQIENEKMDYSYQALGPVGIIPMTKALISNTTVKFLDLKYNKLGMKSIPAIISLIDQNENIVHLNLAGNEIGKGSGSMLGELISLCFSVEFLDLSKNNLGDDELQEIGLSLMKVDSVKELILSSNDFSSAKAPPFGSYINKCSALLKLDLSCCHLEEGAMNIFGGLKISNLTVLNLSRNGIPNQAMQALASGLRTNKSLRELNISYNVISNKGAETLAPGLRGSSTLEIMNLAHNPIQGSAATKLLSSVGSNLKLLDLTGSRVNLAFFKTLRTYAKTGKEIRVLFGSEIRYDLFPRDLTVLDEETLSKDNVVTYLEKLADEKGVSLRNTLKSIHASFIAEQHARLAEEEEDSEKKDEKKNLEMTIEDFAKLLVKSAISVPKNRVQEVAELLSEEGIVNMWKLIARIRWKPDDLNIKIKAPKQPDTDDKKKDKDKKKK